MIIFLEIPVFFISMPINLISRNNDDVFDHGTEVFKRMLDATATGSKVTGKAERSLPNFSMVQTFLQP